MNIRAIALIVVALAMAGGTVFLARGWLNAQRAALVQQKGEQAAPKPAVRVLVAKEDLPIGHFIKPEDLRWQAWPDETVAPSYPVEGRRKLEDFTGAVVRLEMAAGEPLTDKRVVKPGDRGFLAAVLEPGMRAVSVPVNATTGISGFVVPGDRVDVLLTHSIKEEDSEGKAIVRRATETVLSNVRVLAVDQRLDGQTPEATVAKNATLEVTAKQAEVIAVVGDLGKLSLSLRSLRKEELENQAIVAAGSVVRKPTPKEEAKRQRSLTWDSDVSRILRPSGPKSKNNTVAVFRGQELTTIELE
jgi:pilus assembly protein CpaB